MEAELVFVSASETELNTLLEGRLAGNHVDLRTVSRTFRHQSGQFGVVLAIDHEKEMFVQPLAIIVGEQDQRRLLGRFATLRTEISPLSSWCHLVSPKFFDTMQGIQRYPEMGGLLSSWSGLAAIEASILSERPVDKLNIAACLATQSFSLARGMSLWPNSSLGEILDRYDNLHSTIRGSAGPAVKLRPFLEPIWAVLLALMGIQKVAQGRNIEGALNAATALLEARRFKHADEHHVLARAFHDLPEGEILNSLDRLSPEERVRAFDHLVLELRNSRGEGERSNSLSFLAGYLATVAAGGRASIGLADKLSRELPQIVAWSYVIGGLGQAVTWSSVFDGLGRLVARELGRPLRLDDAPQCDFAFEEAVTLNDRQLSDPLVYLKIKQTRYVTVALMPGVNVAVSLSDSSEANRVQDAGRQQQILSRAPNVPSDALSVLADALFPYIQERLIRTDDQRVAKSNRPKTQGGRYSTQKKLPLEK